MTDILDDLAWRGLIAQTTDLSALRADLAAGPVTLYGGFDPTAASLHLGHLVLVLALRRFQEAGHRPIALAGGATGLIGDPRDVGERTMLGADVVAGWTAGIEAQLAQFLQFDDSPTGALAVNNLDWTAPMSAVEFLRDVGKHFSVNVMIGRDTVRRRLDGDGISYTEFSYLLLQSLDYVELHRRHGCRLQIGGSDQWGNILGGVDLVRRVEGATVHAFTLPLVTDASGAKLGKSTGGGGVWLDPTMTSPYAMFQYLLNVDDRDVGTYLRYLTFLSREEIEALDADTADRPAARAAQRRLAGAVTTLVHGASSAVQAEAAGRALFGQGELRELDAHVLSAALQEAPHVSVDGPRPLVELLVDSGLCPSRSAARRAVVEGGAYVNNERVADPDWTPTSADLLAAGWLVLRRGKRSMAGVQVGAR